MLFSHLFSNPKGTLILFLFRLPVILLSLSVHEWAHGFTSYKLGDSTARYMGRLSLNPLRHLDPVGAILLLVAGFGWAKPVMVDPRYFKNPKRDMALTALAGPMSNFILAFIGCFAYFAIASLTETGWTCIYLFHCMNNGEIVGSVTVAGIFATFFYLFTFMNIGLGVFNLLPAPPLDGSKILYAFLPDRVVWRIAPYERYIGLGLMLLIFFGFLDRPLSFLQDAVFDGISALPRWVFGGAA